MIKLTRLLTILALLCTSTLFAQGQTVKSNESLPENAIRWGVELSDLGCRLD